ncbi:hypothetical protein ACFSTC_08260 [Nonomuraea ferruginea]
MHALRDAGLPVSLAEGLDAARALQVIDLVERESLREAYAATLVKKPANRPGFDVLFDLWFPCGDERPATARGRRPGPGPGPRAARAPGRAADGRHGERAARVRAGHGGPFRQAGGAAGAAELVLLQRAARPVARDAHGSASCARCWPGRSAAGWPRRPPGSG